MPTAQLDLTCDHPPSANAMWRAVGGRVIKSAAYRAWSKVTADWVAIQARKSGWRAGKNADVTITVGGPVNRQRDLDNFCKPVLDALVAGGALVSDNLIGVARIELDQNRILADGVYVRITLESGG